MSYQKAWIPFCSYADNPRPHGPSLGFCFSHAECKHEPVWPAQQGCCEERMRRCPARVVCWKPSWLEEVLWEEQDGHQCIPSKHIVGSLYVW